MRSPPAAMRPPSSSCVPRATTPRRRPRKHPIMVKPCSQLSAVARTFQGAEGDGSRDSRGFPDRANEKRRSVLYLSAVFFGA